MKANDIIKEVTQQIVDAMKKGGDWSKPWKGVSGMPNNPVTGTVYQGGNAILLMMKGLNTEQPSDPRWST